ncbi:helix-turn-helix domain-containing protein [Ferruginivarius sediminum]|uniref:helix-turn-helix domain-containing protein n=1 Tax=Ferruginivarius sediminum TaxID=2661937 RepID=UPI001379C435|nr:helix-turn-helix transcriptional regulator [Ferruginivarius sediminum]
MGETRETTSACLGRVLRGLRLAVGLDQAVLAAELDVTAEEIDAFERGVSEPPLITLGEMAELFDVPFTVLLEAVFGEGEAA